MSKILNPILTQSEPFGSFAFWSLEHFNIFCSALWRREDKADKEEYVAILKYCK